MTELPASQFYTGLVVPLYEPLAGSPSQAEEYTGFLDASGQPVLELCCGTGRPLLELLDRGYEIEGLDASADMLERCRDNARAMGLEPTLHLQEMQTMSLPCRYRSIFLAGESFTLLSHDEDARAALERIYEHLLPGGGVLIPLGIPDEGKLRASVGRFREVEAEDGSVLRFGCTDFDFDAEHRRARTRCRYEVLRDGVVVDSLERDLLGSWWPQETFRKMLLEAGFARATAVAREGGLADPEASHFIFLARRE